MHVTLQRLAWLVSCNSRVRSASYYVVASWRGGLISFADAVNSYIFIHYLYGLTQHLNDSVREHVVVALPDWANLPQELMSKIVRNDCRS